MSFNTLHSQSIYKGVVKDVVTKKAIPYAKISCHNQSVYTDAEGNFIISTNTTVSTVTIAHPFYTSQEINISLNKTFYSIYLEEKRALFLPQYEEKCYKEGLQILQKVTNNRKQNNPKTRFQKFSCSQYSKVLVSAIADSIEGRIETSFSKKGIIKRDSSDYKFKKIITKQHLFLLEKVATLEYDKPKVKETVLGLKMSGFKSPIYEIVGFKWQPFSLYEPKIELVETTYQSPINQEVFSHYNYLILDTLKLQNREVFQVYFSPKQNYSGIEGVLFIDAENYGIAKSIVRIKGILDITATQENKFYENENIWFPDKETVKIIKGKNDDDITIFGGTIYFTGDYEEIGKVKKKYASDFSFLEVQTVYSKTDFNSQKNIKRASVYKEIKDNAPYQDESFWQKYRPESLDEKGNKTYANNDSISVKKGIENKVMWGRKIVNGYLPFPYFDVDLRYLLSFNNYEGFRLGFGGLTNEQFSKKLRLSGYTAYGTKDGNFKYHLGTMLRLGKFSSSWIGLSYTDDIKEIASVSFATDKRIFKIYDPRPINVTTFYNHQSWKGTIETKIIPKTESVWQITHQRVEPKFTYAYVYNDKIYTNFRLTTLSFSLQWNPFSSFMQTPDGKIETEKRFPKFTYQFTQSISDLVNSDFTFTKFDCRIEYEKKFLNNHKTSFLFQAGIAFGEVPITHLYNTQPNNLSKDQILQRVTVSGKNSFETMFFNEFFSSEYMIWQAKHSIGRLKLLEKVKPNVVFVHRMAWGGMRNPERHVGIDYNTLEKGYVESGVELNQIFKGFGLAGFYRYGAYSLPNFQDNIALKISFQLDLGL